MAITSLSQDRYGGKEDEPAWPLGAGRDAPRTLLDSAEQGLHSTQVITRSCDITKLNESPRRSFLGRAPRCPESSLVPHSRLLTYHWRRQTHFRKSGPRHGGHLQDSWQATPGRLVPRVTEIGMRRLAQLADPEKGSGYPIQYLQVVLLSNASNNVTSSTVNCWACETPGHVE